MSAGQTIDRLLLEMPRHVTRFDDPVHSTSVPDVVLPDIEEIKVPTGNHEEWERLISSYRYVETSLNLDRLGMFVMSVRRPGDGLYRVKQSGGWCETVIMLLSPEEKKRLLRSVIRLTLRNKAELRLAKVHEELGLDPEQYDDLEGLDQRTKRKAQLELLAKVVRISGLIFDATKRYTWEEKEAIVFDLYNTLTDDEDAVEIIDDWFKGIEPARGISRIRGVDIKQLLDLIYQNSQDFPILVSPGFMAEFQRACQRVERRRVADAMRRRIRAKGVGESRLVIDGMHDTNDFDPDDPIWPSIDDLREARPCW